MVDKKGEICRVIKDACAYIHFQEYIFAICKDGKLMICKIIDGEEERLYGIVLGDIMTILRLMLIHPILSFEFAKRNKQIHK